MKESLKKLHALVGTIVFPYVPRGGANNSTTTGHQLFVTMGQVAKSGDSVDSQLLDKLVDDLRMARVTNLVDDAFLQQAFEYIEDIKQSSGENNVSTN